MAFAPYVSRLEIAWHYGLRALCALVLAFLVVPILAIIPLSFTAGSFLSYPLPGLSVRWYAEVFTSAKWLPAFENSLIVGAAATVLATTLGTLAALGLVRLSGRAQRLVGAALVSPMIVPAVISAVGLYFFLAPLGLVNSYLGLVLAHTVIAVPFVVITIAASLQGFDTRLIHAAASLGAGPWTSFRAVMLPLILPGVVSGAVLAFATSFDEIVLGLFLAGPTQRTIPIQMFNGVREEVSPAIAAAASLLVVLSVALFVSIELLRRRAARIRGALAQEQA